MFGGLTERLTKVFDKLTGRGLITEAVLDETAREIRIALLEADVALPVVKDFIAHIKEKALGNDHSEVATICNNLGIVYGAQENYTKALEYYQRAMNIWKNKYGEDHPYLAATYNNMGHVYLDQGDYGKALEYYNKSLTLLEKSYGSNNPNGAKVLASIGKVYNLQGDYTKALEYYQRALAIRKDRFGEDHPDVIRTMEKITEIEAKMNGQGEE